MQRTSLPCLYTLFKITTKHKPAYSTTKRALVMIRAALQNAIIYFKFLDCHDFFSVLYNSFNSKPSFYSTLFIATPLSLSLSQSLFAVCV